MAQNADWFYTFTGISSADIMTTLGHLQEKRDRLQTELIEQVTHHPPESLVGFTLSASMAFYLTERDTNPQIKTFVDAFYYISTCLTVGYADVYPMTQRGRLIAAVVMIIGPALANNALDPPGREKPASARGQEATIGRLETILEALQ